MTAGSGSVDHIDMGGGGLGFGATTPRAVRPSTVGGVGGAALGLGMQQQRPVSPATFAASLTPASTSITFNAAKEGQPKPPAAALAPPGAQPPPAAMAITPASGAASNGGGGGGGARNGRRQQKSGDAVFKYKRLPISEAEYETLVAAPKIHRSEQADAIFKDTHNMLSLTSNRQKRIRG